MRFMVIECDCGAKWQHHSYEMPPQISICTGCGLPVKLVRYDIETQQATFKKLRRT